MSGHNNHEREHTPTVATESREISKYTVGEVLGWKNVSMDQEKIGDVELYYASGQDLEFVLMHHRLRTLLEANARFSGTHTEGFDGGDVYAELLQRLEQGGNFNVSLLTEGKPNGKQIDLRQLARLVEMKKVNRYLGAKRFTDEKLEQAFFSNSDLSVEFNGETIDLWEECVADSMAGFDVSAYMAKINAYQMGLQWMGNIRDECLQKKHIENAGHSLFAEINRRKLSGTGRETLWMPSSYTMAVANSRGDLQKIDVRQKLNGHVHELGSFDETTGTVVKYEADLLRRHRSGIEFRNYGSTLTRTSKAEVALNQDETASVETETIGGKEIKVLYIGGKNRDSLIYKGMHSTYDRAMEQMRGFKLTEDEAADLIFTDVIGQCIANSTTDWIMSLSKSCGDLINYNDPKSYTKGADEWLTKFGFKVVIRCKQLDDEGQPVLKDGNVVIKEKTFENYNELINYVNARIALGDIEGVKRDRKLVKYEGVDKKTIKAAEEEPDEDDEEDEESETESAKGCAIVFKKIFGDNARAAADEFMRFGNSASITVEGKTQIIIEYIKEKLTGKLLESVQLDLVGFGPVTLAGKEISTGVIDFLKKIGETLTEKVVNSGGKKSGKKKSAEKIKTRMDLNIKLRKTILQNIDG